MILRATGPTIGCAAPNPAWHGRILSTAALAAVPGNFGVPRSHRDCQSGNFKPDSTGMAGQGPHRPAGPARGAAVQLQAKLLSSQ
eukprot:275117-Hanusia_phi.AAC.2